MAPQISKGTLQGFPLSLGLGGDPKQGPEVILDKLESWGGARDC